MPIFLLREWSVECNRTGPKRVDECLLDLDVRRLYKRLEAPWLHSSPSEEGSEIMDYYFGGDRGPELLIEVIGAAVGEIVKCLLRWSLIG
jgi:hypothetical protein